MTLWMVIPLPFSKTKVDDMHNEGEVRLGNRAALQIVFVDQGRERNVGLTS